MFNTVNGAVLGDRNKYCSPQCVFRSKVGYCHNKIDTAVIATGRMKRETSKGKKRMHSSILEPEGRNPNRALGCFLFVPGVCVGELEAVEMKHKTEDRGPFEENKEALCPFPGRAECLLKGHAETAVSIFCGMQF